MGRMLGKEALVAAIALVWSASSVVPDVFGLAWDFALTEALALTAFARRSWVRCNACKDVRLAPTLCSCW